MKEIDGQKKNLQEAREGKRAITEERMKKI